MCETGHGCEAGRDAKRQTMAVAGEVAAADVHTPVGLIDPACYLNSPRVCEFQATLLTVAV